MTVDTQTAAQISAEQESWAVTLKRFASSAAFAKILIGLFILAAWQISADLFAANFVARPSGILEALPGMIAPEFYYQSILGMAEAPFDVVARHNVFFAAVANTLSALCIGLVIALALGIVVGVLMGRIKLVDRLLFLYVVGFYAMPMVAIVPILTIWYGSDGDSRMAIILFAGFFSIVLNMADGARATPPEFIEVARAYRAKPWDVWFKIAIPAAMPYLLAGIRLAAGRALVGAIVAEMIIGVPESMGNFIRFEAGNLRHDEAFVCVLALAFFGVGIEVLLNWATRVLVPWYRREGRAS